nr:hypothetical protein CFP56_59199 [Quercus suber]
MKIGQLAQIVSYEGLSALCFVCGRIGHRKEACPHVIKGPQTENPRATQDKPNNSEEQQMSKDESQAKIHNNELDGYGQWMVVIRKKKAQKPRLAEHREGSATSSKELEARDRRDSKCKASVYADNLKLGAADKTSTSIQKWQSAKGREMKQGSKATGPGHSTVGAGGKKATLRIFKFRSSSGLRAEPKEGQPGPITLNKGLGASRETPVFRFGNSTTFKDHGEYAREVGDILQRENYPNRGHNNQHDQEGSNKSHGVVRVGVNASLEEPFSFDRAELQNRLSFRHGQSMKLDTKFVVEVPNGQTRDPHQHINSIRANLRSLHLKKITDQARSVGRRTDGHREESSQKHTGGVCGNGACPQCEAHPILDASGKGKYACENQPSRNGDFESCCDNFSRGSLVEAGADEKMEMEGAGESLCY